MKKRDDQMIETLFAQARSDNIDLPDGLRAAMERGAMAELPSAPGRSIWQVIGGFWGASGLTVAALAGVWIGLVPLDDAASWADPVTFLTGAAPDDLPDDWTDVTWSLEEG